MEYKYGELTEEQFGKYKIKLHKELFWLLIYKDPKTKTKFEYVDYDKFFDGIMRKLNGLNRLFNYPSEFIELLSYLEAAKIEAESENFNYPAYRKLILDAHAVVDKIGA